MVNMDGFEGMDEDDSFDGDGDFINFDIACPTPPTQHSHFEEPSEHLYATLEEVDLDQFEAFYEEPPTDAGSGIKGGMDS